MAQGMKRKGACGEGEWWNGKSFECVGELLLGVRMKARRYDVSISKREERDLLWLPQSSTRYIPMYHIP